MCFAFVFSQQHIATLTNDQAPFLYELQTKVTKHFHGCAEGSNTTGYHRFFLTTLTTITKDQTTSQVLDALREDCRLLAT